jgi:hypothetical protein
MTQKGGVSLAWEAFSADLVPVVRKRAQNLKVRSPPRTLQHPPVIFLANPTFRPSILLVLLIRCTLKIGNAIKRCPIQINLAVTRSLKPASKV